MNAKKGGKTLKTLTTNISETENWVQDHQQVINQQNGY